jgi:hypothetical protein
MSSANCFIFSNRLVSDFLDPVQILLNFEIIDYK